MNSAPLSLIARKPFLAQRRPERTDTDLEEPVGKGGRVQVIIPAAGFGTRLRPQTWSRPKPLVNVAGKPILGHVLDSIVALHPERVVFVTGYLGDQIREYVKRQYDFEASFVHQVEMK